MKRFVAVNMNEKTFKKLEKLKKDNEFNSNTELLENLLEENIIINEVKLNETYDNTLIAIMEAEKTIISQLEALSDESNQDRETLIIQNNSILNFIEWCFALLIVITGLLIFLVVKGMI